MAKKSQKYSLPKPEEVLDTLISMIFALFFAGSFPNGEYSLREALENFYAFIMGDVKSYAFNDLMFVLCSCYGI